MYTYDILVLNIKAMEAMALSTCTCSCTIADPQRSSWALFSLPDTKKTTKKTGPYSHPLHRHRFLPSPLVLVLRFLLHPEFSRRITLALRDLPLLLLCLLCNALLNVVWMMTPPQMQVKKMIYFLLLLLLI